MKAVSVALTIVLISFVAAPPQCAAEQPCDTLVGGLLQPAGSEPSTVSKPGWLRGEYDFDSRGFDVVHFMGGKDLGNDFSVWGFVDFEGDPVAGRHGELNRFFLEVDLKKKLFDTGGLIAEVNDLQGVGNSIGRLGVYWQPELPQWFADDSPLHGPSMFGIKYFPLETDGDGGQFSFNYNKTFANVLDGRFSVGGFFDLNYSAAGSGLYNTIVSEHQVRVRVTDHCHLITEFRWNEFLRDDFGIAPGIQYRF